MVLEKFNGKWSVVTVEGEIPNVNHPSRFSSLAIALVEEGECRIGIDLQQYTLSPGTVLFLGPREIVSSVEALSKGMRIRAFVTKPIDTEPVMARVAQMLPIILGEKTEPVLQLTDRERKTMDAWMNLLEAMEGEPEDRFQDKKMESLLDAFHWQAFQMITARKRNEAKKQSRKEELVARFIVEVHKSYRAHRTVRHYAERLFITPKHLTSVVSSVTNKTPAQWINAHVVTEAKVMLKNTDKTIQEISSELNFHDQGLFGKYFKQQTGMSPSAYRQQSR